MWNKTRYARRIIVIRDGTIRSDAAVTDRPRAGEVLKTLPSLEDKAETA